MKYNVTQLDGKNVPVESILGNYFLELEPGNYQAEEASSTPNTQPDLLHFSQADELDCKIVDLAVGVDSFSLDNVCCTLYFDGSKNVRRIRGRLRPY